MQSANIGIDIAFQNVIEAMEQTSRNRPEFMHGANEHIETDCDLPVLLIAQNRSARNQSSRNRVSATKGITKVQTSTTLCSKVARN